MCNIMTNFIMRMRSVPNFASKICIGSDQNYIIYFPGIQFFQPGKMDYIPKYERVKNHDVYAKADTQNTTVQNLNTFILPSIDENTKMHNVLETWYFHT